MIVALILKKSCKAVRDKLEPNIESLFVFQNTSYLVPMTSISSKSVERSWKRYRTMTIPFIIRNNKKLIEKVQGCERRQNKFNL